MLVAAASTLLVVAALSGVGGPVGVIGAAAFWLAALNRKPSPIFTSGADGDATGVAGWLVLALVVLTIALRWPIAAHDVEHYPAPDEGEVVENVLEMIRMGDFDQRHPGYPGLHFYLQMLPARVHVAATGQSIPELPRSDFYLRARRLTLVAGAVSVAVVFWIGCQWLSSWSAALGAALVALSPLAFRESAVVNPDLMLTLFVMVAIILSLRLVETRSWSSYALAGLAVGLASAIKYTGAFTVVAFSIAWLVGSSPRRDVSKWLAGLTAAALAFIVTSPYTLLNLPAFFRGLSMHVGYYQAAELNAPWELTRQIATRGVGLVAAVAAVAAVVRALTSAERKLLVLLGYPLTYWFVFSLFDRAFPRHALVLVPFAALLAADMFERATRRLPAWGSGIVAAAFVAGPLLGAIDLWRRVHRETPADAAHAWVLTTLPPGSRILQDQHTPSFDDEDYDVHRLRVEERTFVGNYDWVLRSGYPPGLSTTGLREVARFENDDALGDLIVAYQVPDRASLMPETFPGNKRSTTIGAGQLPFFGQGWYPPEAGAFETSRLSKGERSEIYFLMNESTDLEARLILGKAVNEGKLTLTLNEETLAEMTYSEEREELEVEVQTRAGLNRLELEFDSIQRLNRRHRDTAIRFYQLNLEKE